MSIQVYPGTTYLPTMRPPFVQRAKWQTKGLARLSTIQLLLNNFKVAWCRHCSGKNFPFIVHDVPNMIGIIIKAPH